MHHRHETIDTGLIERYRTVRAPAFLRHRVLASLPPAPARIRSRRWPLAGAIAVSLATVATLRLLGPEVDAPGEYPSLSVLSEVGGSLLLGPQENIPGFFDLPVPSLPEWPAEAQPSSGGAMIPFETTTYS